MSDIVLKFEEAAKKTLRGRKLPPITREVKIRELGIDSLDMMEIIGSFEDDLGVVLPDDQLAALETVADLERAIQGQLAKAT